MIGVDDIGGILLLYSQSLEGKGAGEPRGSSRMNHTPQMTSASPDLTLELTQSTTHHLPHYTNREIIFNHSNSQHSPCCQMNTTSHQVMVMYDPSWNTTLRLIYSHHSVRTIPAQNPHVYPPKSEPIQTTIDL